MLLSLGTSPERIAALTAENPAQRFGLGQKGRLGLGYDADFSLVDLGGTTTLDEKTLFTRYKDGAYRGKTFPGRVRSTYLRGRQIIAAGADVGSPSGRLVTPERRPL